MNVYIVTCYKTGQFFAVFDSLEIAEASLQHTLRDRGTLHLTGTRDSTYFYSIDGIDFAIERRPVQNIVNTIRFVP